MPPKWVMYVHATKDTPTADRLSHIQHMGELVLLEGLYSWDIARSKPLKRIDKHKSNMPRSPYTVLFSIIAYIDDSNEDVRRNIEIVVCGILHNAILRRNKDIGITWDDVYLDDVLPLFSRLLDSILVDKIDKYLKEIM